MSIEVIFIIVLIFLCICLGAALWSEKELHNDTKRCLELSSKQIKELSEKLESFNNTKTIKIEKVFLEPRELECKFMLHDRFVDDTELFKKVIISEVARYMAKELNRDPYLCKVFHEKNAFTTQEHIKVRFRLLPYAEGVVWDDILKEKE